jgi:hypothetical protein
MAQRPHKTSLICIQTFFGYYTRVFYLNGEQATLFLDKVRLDAEKTLRSGVIGTSRLLAIFSLVLLTAKIFKF